MKTTCFEIKSVLGVSLCMPPSMSGYERRAGRAADDDDICYQVRGGFGEDEHDALIPDTRSLSS